MTELVGIEDAIIEGDTEKAVALTKSALQTGVSAKDILHMFLVPGIQRVGELFRKGQYFFPELLISGEAMKAAVDILKPVLSQSGIPPTGKYLIGTVQGDVHDIGKNIVAMMLEGNGWEVTDLGVDISPERFCSAVRHGNFDIVGLSSLLTTTMAKQAETIRALQAAGLRQKVMVMVGGAPVTQAYAESIGADGYASDAVEAVKKAAALAARTK